MAEYIEREDAIAIIEEKQKELCPLGRYSRTMVYGSDRDRFDSWQEIINSIEDIPAAESVCDTCLERIQQTDWNAVVRRELEEEVTDK